MNEPDAPDATADMPADSLDAALAASFGRPVEAPRSSPGAMLPVLLREAEGESGHIVKPNSDAMPDRSQTGDRYQIAGEIARGGMGAVLRGRDVDLGRDLAIKVLLEKYADRPEVARRFLEEAQIGGQLQHPGVVPIYDIGRFGERPFFTMKLVKGQTLANLLAERADHTQERPRLLSIALQVAQTLAYAHAKGVIHRDLKPANVMVGAFGEVQVMDWGLAKVLAEGGIADEERAASRGCQPPVVEGTLIRTARSSGTAGSHGSDTEAGSLLGTPAYMPPEQANGDVANLDRRADVFGLGAILCEVLTGKPPYVGRSTEEVRRKAANGDLADALARLDACGADAELMVLTKACLSPEAIDRPKDARAVADALTAYLDGVQARLHQAELAEAAARARALEEAKRRRLTLALAATVLLAGTLGGSGWLWIKAERDTRQAQVAREVNDALNKATALRERAKTAVVGGAALFAQAREQTQRALALAENGPADEALKEQVRNLGEELDEEEKDRRLLAAIDEARVAQAETLSENRFAFERAVPLLRDALRAYGLPAGEGEPAAVAARIRQRPARVGEAVVAAMDQWLDLAATPRLAITEPHREWLQAVIVAAEPEDGWTRQFRAAREEKDAAKRRAALAKLAAGADAGRLPARFLTRLADRLPSVEALRLLRLAQEQYPADFWVNQDLGLALMRAMPPQPDEAVRFLTAAVALRPESAGAHLNLGNVLREKGHGNEAIACFSKAIALDPKYAVAHSNLGVALEDKGQVDEAIACFKTAIALDPKDATAHSNLGNALYGKRQMDEAIACCRHAVTLAPKYGKAYTNLGNALVGKGQVDEAIACYQKAIALGNDVKAYSNLGNVLHGKGQVDEAIACYRTAIALDPKNAVPHYNLGLALAARRQVNEAIACYQKAIALDPKYTVVYSTLGLALAGKGQMDEAMACFKQAIALDPKDAKSHANLGVALEHKGQADEAIACYRKAIATDPKLANAHGALGQALLGKGHYAEARDASAQALALLPVNHPSRTVVSRQLQQCEQMLKLQARLPAILRDEDQPATARESLDLAQMCLHKKMTAAAARFAATAFAADAKLADDLQAGHRYNAACYAALAAAGLGEDVAKLDDKERARLRKQALDRLRADLAAYGKLLETGPPPTRALVQRQMRHWQQDTDLAGIRDAAALAKLSADERTAFTQLWSDVAELLKKAEETPGRIGISMRRPPSLTAARAP
jgi:eukaryotic-like serine/threonine-protein kinase